MVSMSVVSTEWVSKHLADPSVTIVEVNTDSDKGYNTGHIPGALLWNLHVDLEDEVRRDIPGISKIPSALERLGQAFSNGYKKSKFVIIELKMLLIFAHLEANSHFFV